MTDGAADTLRGWGWDQPLPQSLTIDEEQSRDKRVGLSKELAVATVRFTVPKDQTFSWFV